MYGDRMKKQRGLFYLVGALILALVASLGLNGWLWLRVDNVQLEAENFEIQVEADGKVAKANKEKIDFWNSENMRIANEKLLLANTNNTTLIAELRKQSDLNRSRLPEASRETSRPDLYCADRQEFERRNGESFATLQAETRSIADRGTANSMRLDSACTWAKGIK